MWCVRGAHLRSTAAAAARPALSGVGSGQAPPAGAGAGIGFASLPPQRGKASSSSTTATSATTTTAQRLRRPLNQGRASRRSLSSAGAAANPAGVENTSGGSAAPPLDEHEAEAEGQTEAEADAPWQPPVWSESTHNQLFANILFLRDQARACSPLQAMRAIDFTLESAHAVHRPPGFEAQVAYPPPEIAETDLPLPKQAPTPEELVREEKARWATCFELAADSHPSVDFDVLELTDEEFFLSLYRSDAALKVLAPNLQHSLENPGETGFVPLPLRLGYRSGRVPHLNQSRPLDPDIDASLHELRELRLQGLTTPPTSDVRLEPTRVNVRGQIVYLGDNLSLDPSQAPELSRALLAGPVGSPQRFETALAQSMELASRRPRGEALSPITTHDVISYIKALTQQQEFDGLYAWYMRQPYLHNNRVVTSAVVTGMLAGKRLEDMWEVVQIASKNSCLAAAQLDALIITSVTQSDVLRINLALKKFLRNFPLSSLSDRALHALFRHFTDVGAYFAACMIAEFCRRTNREAETLWNFVQQDKYPSLYASLGMTKALAEILEQHVTMPAKVTVLPRRTLSALQQFVHMTTPRELKLLERVATVWIEGSPKDSRLLLLFGRAARSFKDLGLLRRLWHLWWDGNEGLTHQSFAESSGLRNNVFNTVRSLAELTMDPKLDVEEYGTVADRQLVFFTKDILRVGHVEAGLWPQPAVNGVLECAVGYGGPISQISLTDMLKIKLTKLIRFGFNTSNTPGDHLVRGTLQDIIRMYQVGEAELGRRRLVQFVRFLPNPQAVIDAAVCQLDSLSLLMLTKLVLGLRSFAYSTMILFLPAIYLRLAQNGEWATLVLTFSEVFNHHYTRAGDMATDRLRDLQPAFRILPGWTLSRIVEESLSVYRSPQQIEYFIRTLSRCDLNHIRMGPEGHLPDFMGTRAHIRSIFPLVRELKIQKHIMAAVTLQELMMCLGRNLSTEAAAVTLETLRLFLGDANSPLVAVPGQPDSVQLMAWFSQGLQQLAELRHPCRVLQDIRLSSHAVPYRVVATCFRELAHNKAQVAPTHYPGIMIAALHANFNIGVFLTRMSEWFTAHRDPFQASAVIVQVLASVLAQAISNQAHLVQLMECILGLPFRLQVLSSPYFVELVRKSPYSHLVAPMVFRLMPFPATPHSSPELHDTTYRLWAQMAAQAVAEHPEMFLSPLMFQYPPPEAHPENPRSTQAHPPLGSASRDTLARFLRHGGPEDTRVLHEIAPLLSPFDLARLYPMLVSLAQNRMIPVETPLLALEALHRTRAVHFVSAFSRRAAWDTNRPTLSLLRLKAWLVDLERTRRHLQLSALELAVRQGDCLAAAQALLCEPLSQVRALFFKKDTATTNGHFVPLRKAFRQLQDRRGIRTSEAKLVQPLDIRTQARVVPRGDGPGSRIVLSSPAEIPAAAVETTTAAETPAVDLWEALAAKELQARRAAELGLRPQMVEEHRAWMQLAADSGHLPAVFAARRFIAEQGFVPARRADLVARDLCAAVGDVSVAQLAEVGSTM